MLTVTLTKVTSGEHFADLDMTNHLLARTGETIEANGQIKGPPRIQVMDPSRESPWDTGAFDDALEFDFQIPQTVEETVELKGGKYGFNNQYSGHFLHLQNPDVVTVSNPENKSVLERWEEMRSMEDAKFDKDWYLADRYEPPDELNEAMQFTLPKTLGDPFSMDEQTQLRNMGNRDCTTNSTRLR